MNTYTYGYANPLGNSDPTGEGRNIGIAYPIPNLLRTVPLPSPVKAATTVFAISYGLGTWIYPHIEPMLSTAIDAACSENDSEEEKKKRYCQALYDSTLATCASLSGKKKFACFQAALDNYNQCMGQN